VNTYHFFIMQNGLFYIQVINLRVILT